MGESLLLVLAVSVTTRVGGAAGRTSGMVLRHPASLNSDTRGRCRGNRS